MATETPNHEAHAQAASKSNASRGKAVRFLILAAALTIFVVLLPSLASRTPLGGWLLNYAARKAKLNASISAGFIATASGGLGKRWRNRGWARCSSSTSTTSATSPRP